MKSVKEIVKEPKIFERNKVLFGIKFLRRGEQLRSFLRFTLFSHNAVYKWVKKFEEKLPILTEKKERNLIAIDETVVKANKKAISSTQR